MYLDLELHSSFILLVDNGTSTPTMKLKQKLGMVQVGQKLRFKYSKKTQSMGHWNSTSGIVFAGGHLFQEQLSSTKTETWDGTNWTETAELNTARG